MQRGGLGVDASEAEWEGAGAPLRCRPTVAEVHDVVYAEADGHGDADEACGVDRDVPGPHLTEKRHVDHQNAHAYRTRARARQGGRGQGANEVVVAVGSGDHGATRRKDEPIGVANIAKS